MDSNGPQTNARLNFLMDRYSQLNEQDTSKNQIIHTTFYLSVVFLGVLLGVFSNLTEFLIRAVLYMFSAAIFVSMLLWTRTYIISRNEIDKQRRKIVNEVREIEFDFESVDSVEAFFADQDYQEQWEADGRKEFLLQLYYAALAVLLVVTFLVDLILP